MNFLLLPLLLAAADTGGTAGARAIAIYSEFAVNHDTAPHPIQAPAADRWLGEDKLKHFAFSYLITAGTFAATRAVADPDASVLAGAAVGIAAGVFKEIYDKRNNRSSSARDLVWDALGITAGVIVAKQAR